MILNKTGKTDLATSDFYYDLPKELIAQHPAEKRDMSRLLVMDRRTGELSHGMFYNIVDHLKKGDMLVINDSKVIPARLFGHRLSKDKTGTLTDVGGAAVEVMLLRPCEKDETASLNIDGGEYGELWAALVRPGKRMRTGDRAVFSDELSAVVTGELEDGVRAVKLVHRRETGLYEILDRVGRLPLPPYITEEQDDCSRYQTVYAKYEGSAAAPTAGLHFTEELLGKIREKGIETAPVTLHVGLGTFRPVKEKNGLQNGTAGQPQKGPSLVNINVLLFKGVDQLTEQSFRCFQNVIVPGQFGGFDVKFRVLYLGIVLNCKAFALLKRQ